MTTQSSHGASPPAHRGVGTLAGVRRLRDYIMCSIVVGAPVGSLSLLLVTGLRPLRSVSDIALAITVVLFIATVTYATAAIGTIAQAGFAGRWPGARRPLTLLGVATLTLWVAAAVALRSPVLPAIVIASLIVVLCVTAPIVHARELVLVVVGLIVLTWVGAALVIVNGISVTDGVLAALALSASGTVIVFGAWLNGWMLRVVLELEQAREQAGLLAVTEERLRISRDLHDVFGRTLASVALKSELTAELITRGRLEEAEAQARQVREIAEAAGAQARGVVSGTRGADLHREAEGARALLLSAGIRCTVEAPGISSLSPGARETLGWVVREGATNVIRHARATWCEITMTETSGSWVLTLRNDGAPVERGESIGGPGGTGLSGLSSRITPGGGHLAVERAGDVFTLTVTLPRGAEAISPPPGNAVTVPR